MKQSRPGHEDHCRRHFDIPNFRRECAEIDWTEEKLRRKLQDIAGVIHAVRPQPDVIILPELENPAPERPQQRVACGARLHGRSRAGFHRHRSRPQYRCGHSLALPARGNAARTRWLSETTPGSAATRDITEAQLRLPDGKTLHPFAVPFSLRRQSRCRKHAMRSLNALSLALPPDAIIVAGGDLLRTGAEFPIIGRR